MNNIYMIYVEKYGKVKSGNKIKAGDYVDKGVKGSTPYRDEGKLAVSIAVEDCKNNKPMRTREQLEEKIKKMLGKS